MLLCEQAAWRPQGRSLLWGVGTLVQAKKRPGVLKGAPFSGEWEPLFRPRSGLASSRALPSLGSGNPCSGQEAAWRPQGRPFRPRSGLASSRASVQAKKRPGVLKGVRSGQEAAWRPQGRPFRPRSGLASSRASVQAKKRPGVLKGAPFSAEWEPLFRPRSGLASSWALPSLGSGNPCSGQEVAWRPQGRSLLWGVGTLVQAKKRPSVLMGAVQAKTASEIRRAGQGFLPVRKGSHAAAKKGSHP